MEKREEGEWLYALTPPSPLSRTGKRMQQLFRSGKQGSPTVRTSKQLVRKVS